MKYPKLNVIYGKLVKAPMKYNLPNPFNNILKKVLTSTKKKSKKKVQKKGAKK